MAASTAHDQTYGIRTRTFWKAKKRSEAPLDTVAPIMPFLIILWFTFDVCPPRHAEVRNDGFVIGL